MPVIKTNCSSVESWSIFNNVQQFLITLLYSSLEPYYKKGKCDWYNKLKKLIVKSLDMNNEFAFNPLVPDAHYSERQDNHFLYKFNY